jgi:hypothetical protein
VPRGVTGAAIPRQWTPRERRGPVPSATNDMRGRAVGIVRLLLAASGHLSDHMGQRKGRSPPMTAPRCMPARWFRGLADGLLVPKPSRWRRRDWFPVDDLGDCVGNGVNRVRCLGVLSLSRPREASRDHGFPREGGLVGAFPMRFPPRCPNRPTHHPRLPRQRLLAAEMTACPRPPRSGGGRRCTGLCLPRWATGSGLSSGLKPQASSSACTQLIREGLWTGNPRLASEQARF